jgi:hypothetical protein
VSTQPINDELHPLHIRSRLRAHAALYPDAIFHLRPEDRDTLLAALVAVRAELKRLDHLADVLDTIVDGLDEEPEYDPIDDGQVIRNVSARLRRAAVFFSWGVRMSTQPISDEPTDLGGDPGEVPPSDSRAESQAGLNGPSGSPTSPPKRDTQPINDERLCGAEMMYATVIVGSFIQHFGEREGCAEPHPADPNLLCELPVGHSGAHAVGTWSGEPR